MPPSIGMTALAGVTAVTQLEVPCVTVKTGRPSNAIVAVRATPEVFSPTDSGMTVGPGIDGWAQLAVLETENAGMQPGADVITIAPRYPSGPTMTAGPIEKQAPSWAAATDAHASQVVAPIIAMPARMTFIAAGLVSRP